MVERKTKQNKQRKEKHASSKPKKNLQELLVLELQASHLTALQSTVVLPLFFSFALLLQEGKKNISSAMFLPLSSCKAAQARGQRNEGAYRILLCTATEGKVHEFPLHKNTLMGSYLHVNNNCEKMWWCKYFVSE